MDTQSSKTYKCDVPNGEVTQGAGLSVRKDLRKEVGEKQQCVNG